MNLLRISIVLFCFLSYSTQLLALDNQATIKGKVSNALGEPVADINITLQGTKYGSATNSNGYYEISGVPAGEYVFVASGIGYQSQQRSIAIEKGETLNINVTLSDSKEELQQIVVISDKINKFNRKSSEYVAKVPIRDIENPQVYNTITSDLIDDQVVTTFEGTLESAPGIFKLWESTGRGGDGAGYYSLRGFPVQPTMVNGLPSLTNGSPDPANIERVEIIKGPSGTLYGSSLISYGGLINVVTKKPYSYFGGEISYKTGSFGLNRVTADVNTPVSEEEKLALRVNGAYHIRNSFQDAGQHQSLFIAPSLSYEVNDRLTFLINSEYFESESTNQLMLFLNRSNPLEAENLGELNYDFENSYTNNDLTISNPTFSLQGQMKYLLSDAWTSQTVLSRSSAKTDGYYQYLYSFSDGNRTFGRYVSNQNSTTLGTDIQQNFIGNFEVAGIGNKMVIGLDYFEKNVINNSTGYVLFDQISLLNDEGSGISRQSVDTALANTGVTNSRTEHQIYSAYISDVITIVPRLSVMASLRIDYFDNKGNVSTGDDNYTQTALSPKFGLVYQPVTEKVALFANYMNGFSNVAPRVQDDGSTKNFSPEQANQWEAGIKTSLYSGRITATLSYYDIRVTDVVRQDPDRLNFYIQDGENNSRGLEASITAAPLTGLNIIAGYSYNQSEITKTSSDEYRGRRPESAGPEHIANAWVSYRITQGIFDGAGIGMGANYASENLILNRQTTGTFALPSYTIFNASLFYNPGNYRIDLKINNLSDEEYYKGWTTVNPQRPRSITASFTYNF